MSVPRVVDVEHLGRPRVIGAWVVGDVLIDPGPASSLERLLGALGEWRPRAIALTHIHLDHAGGTGSLVRRWPGVEVWVDERGAPHLEDPSRLLRSAERIYGAEMERLWGRVEPVPADAIRLAADGAELGGFEIAYTPGHASHHVSYLDHDSGIAFVGDVAGVRIEPAQGVLMPTVPPELDPELWKGSIERVREWRPAALAITHFGRFDDVDAHLDAAREGLGRLLATEGDEERVREHVAGLVGGSGAAEAGRYQQAAAPAMLAAGVRRHLERREGDPRAVS